MLLWVFYAVGGARLGPGARGAPPRASTFSATRIVSAKSGGTTQAVLNRDVGADARGSARMMRWCETCRRCADANGFAPNTTGSACVTTTPRSTSLARAPFVMHSAYSPKTTATSESRKEAELRRAMRVPAGSYTVRDARRIAHVSSRRIVCGYRRARRKAKPRHKRPRLSFLEFVRAGSSKRKLRRKRCR